MSSVSYIFELKL